MASPPSAEPGCARARGRQGFPSAPVRRSGVRSALTSPVRGHRESETEGGENDGVGLFFGESLVGV